MNNKIRQSALCKIFKFITNSSSLQIKVIYSQNIYKKKYQNESESYFAKYVFKLNRSRSKQDNANCCLSRNMETFNRCLIN